VFHQSTLKLGILRASHPGSHQLARPNIDMTLGTSTRRTAVLAVPAADVEDLGWGRGDSAGEGYCALGYEQDASGHSSS
jgi:hypothetical protein